ncbi:uncharacterized protein LOC133905699 [Phragmites australis]|uniref:uncharacterized protein LOC133905699 n=1 Tax=Phragmites australis TaxID=29695 RepID=UPI002D78825F|nr:uncharacterized protein LOC133905699 [Phragmites australis]
MREKTNVMDLVRHVTTRFATSFLTLSCLYKHRQALKGLFVDEAWTRSQLSNTEIGKTIAEIVLSMAFWGSLEDCIRAAQPLLIVLRIADGDEKLAMPEIAASMELARHKIEEDSLIFKKTLQIGKKCGRLRHIFNEVLWKMELDEERQSKISALADDYERTEGCFTMKLAIKDRSAKNLRKFLAFNHLMLSVDTKITSSVFSYIVLWWGAYGGLAYGLQSLAKRIVSLCTSASGCERNWSTFEFIHTKKRNRLEHKRLNKLVYISYNRRIASRFQMLRQEGSKGKRSNPLLLQEFDWENEWVDQNAEKVHEGEDLTWAEVDEAAGASVGAMHNLRSRNSNAPMIAQGAGPSCVIKTYSRNRQHKKRNEALELEEPEVDENEEEWEDEEAHAESENDDEDVEDDFGESPTISPHDNDDGLSGDNNGLHDMNDFDLDD